MLLANAAYNMGANAYSAAHKTVMTGREIEIAALTKCALRLKECMEQWDITASTTLVEALKSNQKVWAILQNEVADGSCKLPQEIRMNIWRLAIFISKQTLQAMAYPSPDKLTILIDINMNIAAGLRMSPAD